MVCSLIYNPTHSIAEFSRFPLLHTDKRSSERTLNDGDSFRISVVIHYTVSYTCLMMYWQLFKLFRSYHVSGLWRIWGSISKRLICDNPNTTFLPSSGLVHQGKHHHTCLVVLICLWMFWQNMGVNYITIKLVLKKVNFSKCTSFPLNTRTIIA